MSAEPKNVRIDATTFCKLQAEAARTGKPLDDVANEMMQSAIRSNAINRVLELADLMTNQANRLYPDGLTDDDVVDIVHKRRQIKSGR